MLNPKVLLRNFWIDDFLFYLNNTALEEHSRTKSTPRNLLPCLVLTKIKKGEVGYGIEIKLMVGVRDVK
jgi:hypothetical protein